MAHTQSPWSLASRKAGGPKLIVLGNEATVVAICETADDAKLIASAPDILAALKEARSMLEIVGLDDADEDYRASWAKGRATIEAAIVKASQP